MRLIRHSGGATGLLVGVGDDAVVVDVAAAMPELFDPGPASWRPLIERGEAGLAALRELESAPHAAASVPASSVTLEAPMPDPAARVFAMGGNFPMHVADTVDKLAIEIPDSVKDASKDVPPWGFFVIPGTIVGPGATVSPPAGTQKLDFEAEVAAVLAGSRPGDDGDIEIWGWTAWNDFSIRDAVFGLTKVDHGPLTWSLQKNFTTGNACGAWMVVGEPVPEEGLRISCRVNDETRQEEDTRAMKYGFGEIAAHIYEYLEPVAGDMILSGTPGGTAMEGGPDGRFLADGDVTEVEVAGAGVLRNMISMR